MSTALENVSCPRCSSMRSHVIVTGRDYLYRIAGTYHASLCDDCGLAFQNPRPPLEAIASLYPDDYLPHDEHGETVLPSGQRDYLRRRLGYAHLSRGKSAPLMDRWYRWLTGVRLVPRFIDGGTLLEIGCGSGTRLRELRALGWRDLRGIELVPAAAEKARAAGFEVECGAVEQMIENVADGSLDVVIASMVFEHMTEPFAIFDALARKLKPGGELLFSTVVRDVAEARFYGMYWAGFDFPRHMVFFTRGDLANATRHAFTPLERFHQVAPVDFARSSSWRIEDGKGRLFDRAMVALGRSTVAKAIHVFLAFSKITARVSFRAYRVVARS
jgi:SAM-dependent methyltransferase